MLLTWGLTIAAFVLIFLELKDWSAEDNPHAILGCVTTALAFVQPIGAAFRPHPDSRRRPVFNWLHWLVGNVAHILGSKYITQILRYHVMGISCPHKHSQILSWDLKLRISKYE